MTAAPGGPTMDAVPLDGLDLVIFDKDGTLIDFDWMWAGWAAAVAGRLEAAVGDEARADVRPALYSAMGFDPVAGHVIPGGPLAVKPMAVLRELMIDAVQRAGSTRGVAERAIEQAWFVPDPVASAQPLTDLPHLFGRLRERGLRIAVATADDRAPTLATLAVLGLAGLVDAVACADEGLPTKPAPDAVLHLCRTLDVKPSRTAMVGDAPADLEMGRAAGVALRVGVLSGVGAREDLAALASAIIPSVADLLS